MERGDYETSRQLRDDEMKQRELAVVALHTIDMPYVVPLDPQDELQCESCQ